MMNRRNRRPITRRAAKQRERGAVVIEFAMVFVMFFVVMYGIVCYGVVFALRHSLTHAANEGARAAVKDVGGLTLRIKLAHDTAKDAISWLGALAPEPVVTQVPCPSAFASSCVKVRLTYDYGANPIIPPLPGLGIVLPDTVDAQATVQLDAVS